MLNLVGLGLWSGHITREAHETLVESDVIYFDSYTNVSKDITPAGLAETIGRPVEPVGRDMLEFPGVRKILQKASEENVSIAVIGDPLVATTHIIVLEEAKTQSIPFKVIHGISGVYMSILESLLQIYKFGRITTLVYPYGNTFPYSVLKQVYTNICTKSHSLVLLDLKLDEGKIMHANEAADIIVEMEQRMWDDSVLENLLSIIVEAAGTPWQRITVKTLGKSRTGRYEIVPQSIVIPGFLHFEEEESLAKLLGASEEALVRHKETLKSRLADICKRAGLHRGEDVV
jgi:diphthine synthase